MDHGAVAVFASGQTVPGQAAILDLRGNRYGIRFNVFATSSPGCEAAAGTQVITAKRQSLLPSGLCPKEDLRIECERADHF